MWNHSITCRFAPFSLTRTFLSLLLLLLLLLFIRDWERSYLWELLAVDVLSDIWVPVLGVPLVDRVDLSSWFDTHVAFSEDEFTDHLQHSRQQSSSRYDHGLQNYLTMTIPIPILWGKQIMTHDGLGAIALTVGSVPRTIVPKLGHFHWLLKMNNQLNWHNLGTILRGTDPTVSATAPWCQQHLVLLNYSTAVRGKVIKVYENDWTSVSDQTELVGRRLPKPIPSFAPSSTTASDPGRDPKR